MLWMLGIAIIPLVAILAFWQKSDGRISSKELAILIGQCLLVSSLGVWIGLSYKTTSTEVWNGRVTSKDHGWGSCCHCRTESYACGTDAKGNTQYCTRPVCDHVHDEEWTATSSNGETVYSNTCNAPGTNTPVRWQQIRVGEPTAVEHYYTNYIRANPDTILRTRGLAAQFAGRLPAYPRMFDHYRINRVMNAGTGIDGATLQDLETRLNEANANLGAARQVNINVVLTSAEDRRFAEALREHWILNGHGAEKNDFTVVMGISSYPHIDWVEFVTWTRNERVKMNVRDRLERLATFSAPQVAHIIANEVDNHFVRRSMADYEYLYATVSPPTWILILAWLLEMIITGVLTKYFYDNDPFERRTGFGLHRRFASRHTFF